MTSRRLFLLLVASLFVWERTVQAGGPCAAQIDGRLTTVARKAAQGDLRCLNFATSAINGDVTACVDSYDWTMRATEDSVLATFARACTPPPSWGVDAGTCCVRGPEVGNACSSDTDCSGSTCAPGGCLVRPVEAASDALMHDIFGPRCG